MAISEKEIKVYIDNLRGPLNCYRLHYIGITYTIHCEEKIFNFLFNITGSHFDFSKQQKAKSEVTISGVKSSDSHLFDGLLKEIKTKGKPIIIHNVRNSLFKMKGISLSLPWATLIYHSNYDSIVIVLTEEKHILALTKSGDLGNVMLHIVRSLLIRNIEYKREALVMHAATLEFKDKGLLIVGPSGSGKTTLLFRLMRGKGFNPVSNDRTILIKEKNAWRCFGWPAYISIPKFLFEKPGFNVLPEKEVLLAEGKVYLNFKQLDHMFNKRFVKNIHLSAVVMLTKEPEDLKPRRQAHFFNQIFTLYDPEYRSWIKLFDMDKAEMRKKSEQLYEFIDRNIPWITISSEYIVNEKNMEFLNKLIPELSDFCG